MKLLPGLALILLLVQGASCKHEVPQPSADPITGGGNGGGGGGGGGSNYIPCDSTKIYWARDIRPLITAYCSMYNPNGDGCHDNARHAKGLDFSSYNSLIATSDVNDGLSSDFYQVLIETDPGDRMPRGMPALTQAQINLIAAWINQGADSLYCDWACDTASVTFSGSVWPIIDANCKSCHSGSNPSYGISLTNYNEVAARVQTGQLQGAIKKLSGYHPMPANYSLSPCEIRKIEIWNDAGRPNN